MSPYILLILSCSYVCLSLVPGPWTLAKLSQSREERVGGSHPKKKIKKPKVAHAKTRPSLWLEGFPILSVVHPHNRTLADLLPTATENYRVYYRGRNQTSLVNPSAVQLSEDICYLSRVPLSPLTPGPSVVGNEANRYIRRSMDQGSRGQVALPIHFYALVLPLTRSGTPWPDQVKQHLITISL
jgi:hypothetical protein